jgi:dipeptidyl aminopeptidase/acylaminoacyl peptidase
VKVNQARAESLYVSTDPDDHPQRNFERDLAAKRRTDSIYAARSRGVMEFSKVQYRSRAGDMDVPAYVFAPLAKRGARGHAAMVWVHGGVHGDWNEAMLPFVKEAVQRGYVIITPDYRGSNGYGAAHYKRDRLRWQGARRCHGCLRLPEDAAVRRP